MFKLMGKKILQFYAQKVSLSRPIILDLIFKSHQIISLNCENLGELCGLVASSKGY